MIPLNFAAFGDQNEIDTKPFAYAPIIAVIAVFAISEDSKSATVL